MEAYAKFPPPSNIVLALVFERNIDLAIKQYQSDYGGNSQNATEVVSKLEDKYYCNGSAALVWLLKNVAKYAADARKNKYDINQNDVVFDIESLNSGYDVGITISINKHYEKFPTWFLATNNHVLLSYVKDSWHKKLVETVNREVGN